MDGNTFTDTYSSENAAMLAEYTNSVVKLAAYPTPGTDVGSEMGGASVVLLKHCYFASISNLSVQHTRLQQKLVTNKECSMGVVFANFYGPLFLNSVVFSNLEPRKHSANYGQSVVSMS